MKRPRAEQRRNEESYRLSAEVIRAKASPLFMLLREEIKQEIAAFNQNSEDKLVFRSFEEDRFQILKNSYPRTDREFRLELGMVPVILCFFTDHQKALGRTKKSSPRIAFGLDRQMNPVLSYGETVGNYEKIANLILGEVIALCEPDPFHFL